MAWNIVVVMLLLHEPKRIPADIASPPVAAAIPKPHHGHPERGLIFAPQAQRSTAVEVSLRLRDLIQPHEAFSRRFPAAPYLFSSFGITFHKTCSSTRLQNPGADFLRLDITYVLSCDIPAPWSSSLSRTNCGDR